MALLPKDDLDVSVVAPEGCQLFLRDFDMLSAVVKTVPFAQFFRQLLQFAFRTSGELSTGYRKFVPSLRSSFSTV